MAYFLQLFNQCCPRLLSAAAPPGNTARENRRQCLKASAIFNCSLSSGFWFTKLLQIPHLGFEALAGKENPSRNHCTAPYATP